MFLKCGVDDIKVGGRKYGSSVAVLKSKGLCSSPLLSVLYKSWHFRHLSSLRLCQKFSISPVALGVNHFTTVTLIQVFNYHLIEFENILTPGKFWT